MISTKETLPFYRNCCNKAEIFNQTIGWSLIWLSSLVLSSSPVWLTRLPYQTAPMATGGTTESSTSVNFHDTQNIMAKEPIICTTLRASMDMFTVSAVGRWGSWSKAEKA